MLNVINGKHYIQWAVILLVQLIMHHYNHQHPVVVHQVAVIYQKLSRSYDAIQIFFGADNFDTCGFANVGTVCNTNGYNTELTGIKNENYMYPTSITTNTAAHELGRNCSCNHDQVTTCRNNGDGSGDDDDDDNNCRNESLITSEFTIWML